jgi:Protein of unknown function (DUF1614)
VRYAYESLGVSSGAAMFLLFATLVGSIFNIPVAELPPERIVSHEVIHFFGMRYRVPVVTHWAGTVIAVNVGGAVIPTLMSVSPDQTRAVGEGLDRDGGCRAGHSLVGRSHSRARNRGAGVRPGVSDRRCRAAAVARGCSAACLYRWQLRYVDRR